MGRIDNDLLRKLWRAGVATKDIARLFEVTPSAVSKAARRVGLPGRLQGDANTDGPRQTAGDVISLPRRRQVPSFGWHPDQDRALREADSYAQRAELAARWGKSVRAVQARWLMLRGR